MRISLFLFLLFVISPSVHGEEAKRPPPLFPVALKQEFPQGKEAFEKARELILKNYYSTTLTEDALYWAAVRGMLRHISPPANPEQAQLLSPQEFEKFSETLKEKEVFQVSRLPHGIGLVEIAMITEGGAQELGKILEKLKEEKARAVILDFRNNRGGLVSEAMKMADLFLPKKRIVLRTVEHDVPLRNYVTSSPDAFDLPLVLLVNENTASASEIFAAALRDHKRATVVGSKTYGKALLDSAFPLPNRYQIRFATSALYAPLGRSWFMKGIEPDREVPQEASLYDQLKKKEAPKRLEQDAPLLAAYKLLREKKDY